MSKLQQWDISADGIAHVVLARQIKYYLGPEATLVATIPQIDGSWGHHRYMAGHAFTARQIGELKDSSKKYWARKKERLNPNYRDPFPEAIPVQNSRQPAKGSRKRGLDQRDDRDGVASTDDARTADRSRTSTAKDTSPAIDLSVLGRGRAKRLKTGDGGDKRLPSHEGCLYMKYTISRDMTTGTDAAAKAKLIAVSDRRLVLPPRLASLTPKKSDPGAAHQTRGISSKAHPESTRNLNRSSPDSDTMQILMSLNCMEYPDIDFGRIRNGPEGGTMKLVEAQSGAAVIYLGDEHAPGYDHDHRGFKLYFAISGSGYAVKKAEGLVLRLIGRIVNTAYDRENAAPQVSLSGIISYPPGRQNCKQVARTLSELEELVSSSREFLI